MNHFDAEYEAAQEAVTEAILINEQNLAGHFNHYSEAELIKLLSTGKKFLRLKEGLGHRCIEIEDLSSEIAQDNEFTLILIRETLEDNASIESVREMLNAEIERRIAYALQQIKEDWSDFLNGN